MDDFLLVVVKELLQLPSLQEDLFYALGTLCPPVLLKTSGDDWLAEVHLLTTLLRDLRRDYDVKQHQTE